jgi:hypothetical protein
VTSLANLQICRFSGATFARPWCFILYEHGRKDTTVPFLDNNFIVERIGASTGVGGF